MKIHACIYCRETRHLYRSMLAKSPDIVGTEECFRNFEMVVFVEFHILYNVVHTTVIQFINLTVNNVFVSAIKFNVLTLTAHKDEKEKPSV